MLRAVRRESGESLAAVEGNPSRSARLRWSWHWASLGGALIAVGLAFGGLSASLAGFANAGVEVTGSGVVVDRSGYAWLDGVRTGQAFVSRGGETGAEPYGLVLITRDGSRTIVSRSAPHDLRLRVMWPIGVIAAVIGLLAVPLAYARRPLGALLAMATVLLASEPITQLHSGVPTAIALTAATLAPMLFFATRPWLGPVIRTVMLGAGAGLALAWLTTRIWYTPVHESIEAVRGTAAFSLLLIAAGAEGLRAVRASGPPAGQLRLIDALSLAAALGGTAALIYILKLDPLVTAGILLAAIVTYPRFRRLALRAADRLFLSDLRERAAIESAEEERARLARDIHDTSLQELAGVIGQLQSRPDTADESEALRRVADQLRRMSTGLRPPVLDDLGLGAALEFAVERTRGNGIEVTATIADEAGFEQQTRAPASVELAVFRIVEQALSNVLLHSGATHVSVGGTVANDRVEVTVRDDGRGIARADLEEAARRGRLGLASMRRRAELIGATLDVDGSPGYGTTVAVRWSR